MRELPTPTLPLPKLDRPPPRITAVSAASAALSRPCRVAGSVRSCWACHIDEVREAHLAPVEFHVHPRSPLPVERFDQTLDGALPALINRYLRLGAKVLGPPAWDPDFNSADLPMMMRVADLPARYRKHYR